MLAFHNDPAIKQKYLDRVLAHAKADEIVKGYYWKNGKGCAVGCTVHSGDHKNYETELGIPEWLARVEDTVFEGLPNDRAKLWPEQFLSAVKVGADLEKIKFPFLIFVVESTLDKFDHAKFPKVKAAVDGVLALLRAGETDKKKYAAAAADAAADADAADADAYAAAAYAAADAYAADAYAAAAAAAAAADAAADAADAYAAAAAAAADAADAADAAADDAYAADAAARKKARQGAFVKFADKLLELLAA